MIKNGIAIFTRLAADKQVPFDQVVSTIFKYFARSDRKQIKVLELGCGTANNIAFLAKEGFDAYGVDGSEHAISIGRRFLQSEGLEQT